MKTVPLDQPLGNGLPAPPELASVGHRRKRSSVHESVKSAASIAAAAIVTASKRDTESVQRCKRITRNHLKRALPCFLVLGVLSYLFYWKFLYWYPQAPVFPVSDQFTRSQPIVTSEETPNGRWTFRDSVTFAALRMRCLEKLSALQSTTFRPCGIPAIYFGISVTYACMKASSGHYVEVVNPVITELGGPERPSGYDPDVLCEHDGVDHQLPAWRYIVTTRLHQPTSTSVYKIDIGRDWKTVSLKWHDEDAFCVQQMQRAMAGIWPCNDRNWTIPADRHLDIHAVARELKL